MNPENQNQPAATGTDGIGKLPYIENENDMEDIILKPSTELIPDEYEHTSNADALVHVFRGEFEHDADNTTEFLDSLEKIGYKVSIEVVHHIKKKAEVLKQLEESKLNSSQKFRFILLSILTCKIAIKFVPSQLNLSFCKIHGTSHVSCTTCAKNMALVPHLKWTFLYLFLTFRRRRM